ncbi:BRCA1-A complex subunit RAP80 isoform X2 [Mugil cephalus]|uniref:BRCA1-A complex subunit RAP80 isoform X2 n=1 Tax=Mugil cephalus TaxID=48193 RepID=UPI001FB7D100|nr:BRCA1-A complex subunit RAP80 isoform X2 [Mugil cephalus]
MRGRRRQSTSSSKSVALEQTGMALRKPAINDTVSESQQMDEDTQEDDDTDNKEELSVSLLSVSSARDKRRRGRETKPKPKEMTEEEMMDLALRLSKQEASVSALRQREEDEAVMKAIQESVSAEMVDQASQSESLRLCSRRKLLYPNGIRASAPDEDDCESKTDLSSDMNSGDDDNRSKKRRRKAESPLPEMPDLSQTQKISSQDSLTHLESLDSPLSSDSTQIDDCELRKSPVFPLTGCRAEVQISRLNQNLLDSCRNSGFVFCSQDSCTSTQKSARPKSPTFPGRNVTPCPKSPVFSENDRGDDREAEPSPEYVKSPVFGRNTQREASPSACKPHGAASSPTCENSGFNFSSQESLSPSARASSSRPKSPVFPSSPGLPENSPSSDELIIISDTPGRAQQSHGHRKSPGFDMKSIPSAAELLASNGKGSPSGSREDTRADGGLNSISRPSESDKPKNRFNKDWNSPQVEMSSDMKLVWSDEGEEDVTPASSPSPVFPEEAPVHRAESQTASLNHEAAASPETTGLNRSRLRPSTTEQDLQGKVSATSPSSLGEPTGRQTVHYYWGVPFCPRGLDPDRYTQVILAQMEVYKKSLKQAQRCLLRKAEWGEAVLPQPEKSPSPESPSDSPQHPAPRRRGLRLRGKKQFESADFLPADEEDEEEETKGEEEEKEKKNKEEGEKIEGDEGQVDNDDCVVCPETQLSDDSTQDLIIEAEGRAEPPPESPELCEVEMILRDDSPAGDEPLEHEEDMEVDGEPKKGLAPVSSINPGGQTVREEEEEEQEVKVDRTGPDVNPDAEQVKHRGLQRSTSPELESTVVSCGPKASVDCPICQTSFPASEIEVHAAYCDGDGDVDVDERRPEVVCSQVSLKPWRKRTKRSEVAAEETSDSGKNQKCYICQRGVPLREYSRHTELCIRRHPVRSAAKGNLLSALEQNDGRDSEAGPSGSKLQPSEVIDLNDDDDDDDDDISTLRISNSPIRSFTSISEATDCLIDFKKTQRTKKLSRRRR